LVAALHIEWQQQAECRGPQAVVFFPPTAHERRVEKAERERLAKAICEQCAVRASCLDYALNIREQHGIWGGKSESDRRHLNAVR